jgi:hypothetical protein
MTVSTLFLTIWFALACGPSIQTTPMFQDCFNEQYVEQQWANVDDAFEREVKNLDRAIVRLNTDTSIAARDEYVASYNAALRALHVWGADANNIVKPEYITTTEHVRVTGGLLLAWMREKYGRDVDRADALKQWISKFGGVKGFDAWFNRTNSVELYGRRAQAAAARDLNGIPISSAMIDDLRALYATGGNQARNAVNAFDRRFATPGLAEFLVKRSSSNQQ